jgi:L-malate glycosyltransferase
VGLLANHRFAVVAPGEVFGGAERQILALLGEVSGSNTHRPTLIAFHDSELAARGRDQGFHVHVLGVTGLYDRSAIRRLRQIISDEEISAISVHGYRATVYLSLAFAECRFPVVKTEHGSMELLGNGPIRRARLRLYRWLELQATRRLGAHTVFVTRDLMNLTSREYMGMSRSVIYNGLEALTPGMASRPNEFQTGSTTLAVIGRLDHVKGCDIAVRAVANSSMPSGAHLAIVGSGPELSSLTTLAATLGVGDRVQFLGFRANAYDYIAHADILIMPSRHEGLPYTLLEALSLGTPVVAAKVGGLSEALENERTAILIEPDNPEAVARAVRRLTESPTLRDRLVTNGKALVAERFSARRMAEEYSRLFASLSPPAAAIRRSSTPA